MTSEPLIRRVLTAVVVIAMAATASWVSFRMGSMGTALEYKDKTIVDRNAEIDYLHQRITTLTEELSKSTAHETALATSLGLLPDPALPVDPEILRASRQAVNALVDPEHRKNAYEQLVAISYVETRHRPWLIGALGERSNYQIMPYHIDSKDKSQAQSPWIGAKYAVGVLQDFGAIKNPRKTWRYNGDPDYQQLYEAARKQHFPKKPEDTFRVAVLSTHN